MLVMYPVAPCIPSFCVFFPFGFHFPLCRVLFSGQLTSCKPTVVHGVKMISQIDSSGLWALHSWQQENI